MEVKKVSICRLSGSCRVILSNGEGCFVEVFRNKDWSSVCLRREIKTSLSLGIELCSGPAAIPGYFFVSFRCHLWRPVLFIHSLFFHSDE
jgi:hypothetical protein